MSITQKLLVLAIFKCQIWNQDFKFVSDSKPRHSDLEIRGERYFNMSHLFTKERENLQNTKIGKGNFHNGTMLRTTKTAKND